LRLTHEERFKIRNFLQGTVEISIDKTISLFGRSGKEVGDGQLADLICVHAWENGDIPIFRLPVRDQMLQAFQTIIAIIGTIRGVIYKRLRARILVNFAIIGKDAVHGKTAKATFESRVTVLVVVDVAIETHHQIRNHSVFVVIFTFELEDKCLCLMLVVSIDLHRETGEHTLVAWS